ncbi:MAG TPA: glycoside hydrolase family 57 protein [Burkholderiales bacterium]
MSQAAPVDLVLLWHMHQPDYRNLRTGEFVLPWVYLHAMKDYTDMAFHLESHPGVKAVVNFVPVLLDQLEAYAEQFAMGDVRDPLLRLLAASNLDHLDGATRAMALEACFKSNHRTMLDPFPHYKRLHEIYQATAARGEGALAYLSGQYLADLLVWYHLAWTGESVRRHEETIVGLMAKGEGYTHADRFRLFNLIGEMIRGIIPRYRRLAERGQIELSATPHYHPLAPLLLDFASAREALPDIELPGDSYPGGRTRVQAHLDSALESHARRFGTRPAGMWPAEGAVSDRLLEIFAERGIAWAATSESVLANSLRQANPGQPLPERRDYIYRPYRVPTPAGEVRMLFRDERLSDLIGFEYAKWFGKDAALHFVHSLDEVRRAAPAAAPPLVSVILDGENAWEYYPYNAFYFLSDLYSELESRPVIRTLTCAEAFQAHPAAELPRVTAGSWVYGTFSTWIGAPEKNAAWLALCEAKRSYDLVVGSGRLSTEERAQAERQLSDCEGSDWFWWFGDYNPQHSVVTFDRLFRDKLAQLYRLLRLPVPAELGRPFSRGGGEAETGGVMRRAS